MKQNLKRQKDETKECTCNNIGIVITNIKRTKYENWYIYLMKNTIC